MMLVGIWPNLGCCSDPNGMNSTCGERLKIKLFCKLNWIGFIWKALCCDWDCSLPINIEYWRDLWALQNSSEEATLLKCFSVDNLDITNPCVRGGEYSQYTTLILSSRYQCYAFEPAAKEEKTYDEMIIFPNQVSESESIHLLDLKLIFGRMKITPDFTSPQSFRIWCQWFWRTSIDWVRIFRWTELQITKKNPNQFRGHWGLKNLSC